MATKTQNFRSAAVSDEAASQAEPASAALATSPENQSNPEGPAKPDETAAAADRVFQHVPDASGGADEAEQHIWREGATAVLQAVRSSKLEYDAARLISFLMAVLDYIHAADPTYDQELKIQKLTRPASNHEFAPASAAIFNRNIQGNPQASKDIAKDCRAFDGLSAAVNDRPGGLRSFSRSRQSIEELFRIAKKNGGIAGLGTARDNKGAGDAKMLALSRERVREIIAERASSRLSAAGVSLAVVAMYETAEGKIEYRNPPAEALLPAEPEKLVLSHVRTADDRIQVLAELFQLSHAIRERETDRPADPNENPDASTTRKRLTSRQFVIRADGTITVSPILTSSSTVIRARLIANEGLLRQPMHGDLVLQTSGRRKAETNIVPVETRGVWDFKLVRPAPAKEGVGRIQITTKAEDGWASGKRQTDVGALLQQVKSSTDENPLEVVDAELEWLAHCSVNRDVFDGFTTFPKELDRVLARQDQPLTLMIRDGFLVAVVAGAERKMPSEDNQSEAKISIAASDYVDFLSAFARISKDVTSNLVCAIGREDLVVFRFGTRLVSYEVFLPAMRDGHRSNRLLRSMRPQAWPVDKAMIFDA